MLPDSPASARPPEPAGTPSDELVPSEVAVATPVQQPQFIGTATSPADIPTSPAAGLGAAEMEQHVAERLATNRAELISLRMDALCKRALKEGLPVRPLPTPLPRHPLKPRPAYLPITCESGAVGGGGAERGRGVGEPERQERGDAEGPRRQAGHAHGLPPGAALPLPLPRMLPDSCAFSP